jgi:hypothetical protein
VVNDSCRVTVVTVFSNCYPLRVFSLHSPFRSALHALFSFLLSGVFQKEKTVTTVTENIKSYTYRDTKELSAACRDGPSLPGTSEPKDILSEENRYNSLITLSNIMCLNTM